MSEKSTRNVHDCAVAQRGTELLRCSTSNATWLLQNLQERCNFNVSAQKKEIPV